jgi:hypothetical protein
MAPPRRRAPPLAPILLVLGLLGPMHLSSSWNAVRDTRQEPLFSRADFQGVDRKVSAPLVQSPPATLALTEQNPAPMHMIQAARTPNQQQQQQQQQPRRYQHADLGNLTSAEFKLDIYAYEIKSPKSSFDPVDYPMFLQVSIKKVLFLTQKMGSGKFQHVFLDGLRRSNYIELVDIISLNATTASTYTDQGEDLWMDDSPTPECSYPMVERYAAQQTRHVPILQLDYKDFSMLQVCSKLTALVGGKHNMRYAKRSIVEGREFNWTTGWVDHGHYSNNTGYEHTGGPILHAPYTVRTDQVQALQGILNQTNFTSPVDYEPKTFDITHFWGKGHDPVSHLRNRITEICQDFNGKVVPNGKKLKGFCRLAGTRGTQGRRNVQEEYLKVMLKSRIVIVTQRDKWEGHYRLMEALAGGAMVVADFMLSLPKGLVDRESVVLFRTQKELEEVLLYYAHHEEERRQIAQRGWEIAMGRHRSWHRMEELLFGRPLTNVNNPYGPYKKE